MREAIIADNFPSWVFAYCEKNYSGKLTVKFKHALKPVILTEFSAYFVKIS